MGIYKLNRPQTARRSASRIVREADDRAEQAERRLQEARDMAGEIRRQTQALLGSIVDAGHHELVRPTNEIIRQALRIEGTA